MKRGNCRLEDWGPRQPFRLAIERFKIYVDDWKDGYHRKVASAALLIFLTSVGPAMSFGEYLSNNLNGSYGVLEVLVTTALCGTIFSLISGSPLVIVGATGPFSIFGFNCYRLAQMYDIPFLPWMAWIMVISGLQHIVLGLIGASTKYLPSITSFSGQVFGVLISMIYIVESCQNVAESFQQGSNSGRLDGAFFYSIIAFGQLAACMYLHGARSWLIFNETIRDIIADYGPSLTIIAFTGFTLIPSFSSVSIVRINIPSSFNTTSGRPWLVDFNDPGLSAASKGLAFFPALVLTALYFFDHNVSALLTHRSEFKLKKVLCYDWDFMVLGFMMIVCGVLGLPPCNGLIPNSPMHSKALIVYKTTAQKEEQIREDQQNQIDAKNCDDELVDSVEMRSFDAKNCEDELADNVEKRRGGSAQLEMRRNSVDPDVPIPQQRRGSAQLETRRNSLEPNLPIPLQRRGSNAQLVASLQKVRSKPEFDHVVDQRLSNLLQSGMVAIMLLILPVVALVPSCVVTGLFLFMGVESLLDGDIYSRIILPFVEKQNRGFLDLGESISEDFLDRNIKAVHVYTLIQLVAFGIVFYVTQTVASIIFPVIILLLIPLRFRVLPRMSLFSRVGESSNSPNDFFDVMDKPLIYSAAEPAVVSADAAPNSVPPPPEAVGAVAVGECESGQHSMHEQNISGAVVVGIPPESVVEFRRRVQPSDHPHIGDSTPPDLLRAFHNYPAADSH